MSAKLHSPHILNGAVHLYTPIKIFDTWVYGGSVPLGALWQPHTQVYVPWDLVLRFMDETMVDHGFHDANFVFGLSPLDLTSSQDADIPGRKPRNNRFNAQWDYERYGNLLSNLAILNADKQSAAKRFRRDHEVTHRNISGSVQVSFDEDTGWYTFPYLKLGWLLPGISTLPAGPVGFGVKLYDAVYASSPILGPTTTTPSYPTTAYGALTHEVLETLGTSFSMIGDDAGGRLGLWRSIDELEISRTARCLDISYIYEIGENSGLGPWGTETSKVHITLELVDWDPLHSNPSFTSGNLGCNPYGGGNVDLVATYRAYRLKQSYFNGYNYYEHTQPGAVTWQRNYRVKLARRVSGSTPVDVDNVIREVVSLEDRFGQYFERQVDDLRPSAFYSTADAMESYLLTLRNNYVESLFEIGEVASLIPDFALVIRAATAWWADPVASLVAFGDFVSDFCLKYNFAWAPDAAAVSELTKLGPELGRALDRLDASRTVTLAGKFHWDFPWHPFWGDIHLETRSTISIKTGDSSLINTIMKLDSAGLLPDLHRVWEVLPYSFAVDWVTGVGRRLHDIDNSVKLFSLMQLQWAEHTFQCTASLPGHLAIDGVDLVNSDAQLRWFRRDLSRRIPPLRQGAYDFRAPTGGPSFGILGSLLYKRR